MILIADSGSTKTDWMLEGNTQPIHTPGINPFFQTTEEIASQIADTLLPQLESPHEITAIYFYGAGCTPQKAGSVKSAIRTHFPQIQNPEVGSDLLGAARALCGKEPGVACILGTGSNSCEYDGRQITANISPLGFILGDEGSGASIGKRFVGDCLKQQLPTDISEGFLQKYQLTPADIIDKVYRQPFPNRFLAGFTPYIYMHRQRPEIQSLLQSCFTDFFRRNVMQYNYQNTKVHFTGSIAWYFQDEVKTAAEKLNIHTGKFIQSPIKGLTEYHF